MSAATSAAAQQPMMIVIAQLWLRAHSTEADSVGDVVAAGDRGRIQRGQQHVSRLAHHPFADHPVAAQGVQLIAG
jgi:hypothetical protein